MGGITSKLHRYLEIGDEEMSAKIIDEHSELLKSFSANEVVNELNETPLLLCSKWSMTSIVKKLLFDCNGNPNRRNVFNQTALHLVCQIPIRFGAEIGSTQVSERSEPNLEDENQKRADCLKLILDWNRVCLTNKTKKVIETIDVNALDRNGNTALHLAATYGLFDCTKILIDNNCELFIENESGDTAIDLAAKSCHLDILKYLQYKMIYSDGTDSVCNDTAEYLPEECYYPMKPLDLEQEKTRLIAETSNILSVPLSCAEVLLRSFDWSQESLVDHWFNDSNFVPKDNFEDQCEAVCSKTLPESIDTLSEQSSEEFCEICSTQMDSMAAVGVKCGHQFCAECWKTYLELKIESGETSAIRCPAYHCSHLVPMEIIEKVVSQEMYDRFVAHDMKTFIESNPSIKWCPFPTCNTAVYMSQSQLTLTTEQSYILANMPPVLPLSHAVDCGSGHHFCWECGREAHSPCDCKLWDDWLTKTSDIKAEELKQTYSRTEDAANSLWLVRNAKQCPRCKTHIQKSEGCNHLRCIKCKFDFCWVCLESWRKHNSGTGGYFRCNRSEAAQRAEQNICLLKRVAEAQNCEMKELKKFVFHYTKFKFNALSDENANSLIERSKERQNQLLSYSLELLERADIEEVNECDTFLVDATVELIKARKVLCGSAVYGYYLEDHGYNKAIFEYLENNVNHFCGRLSDIIEPDFIKNSRKHIIEVTRHLKTKRLDFLLAIAKGLVPPETPPGLRRHQKRHCLPGVMALDSMENLYNPCEDSNDKRLNEAIISSLIDYNDKNSWIQDRNGRHNNVYTIYDWPDDCHVDYCDCRRDPTMSNPPDCQTANTSKGTETSDNQEICSYLFCNNPKAKNMRTGKRHDFCSLKCKYLSESEDTADDHSIGYDYDPSMDILIAIEMSKLSYDEERARLNRSDSEVSEDPSEESPFERYVTNIKANPDVDESSTKTAVMYFLKSSYNDVIDDKNVSDSLNDLKVDKKLFSSV